MYEQITIINNAEHADLKFTQTNSFDFAKEVSHVPLATSEYFVACKSQPIVFVKENENIASVGLLGLKEQNNLFVSKHLLTQKQQWRVGEYVPFFLRRYPFIFAQTGDEFSLAFDKTSKAFSTTKGDPLFDENKEPSELAKTIMQTMSQYQADLSQTSLFTKKLEELGLLVDLDLQVTIQNHTYGFQGFLKVSEEKLVALDDETKLELLKNGMYNLITAHLISLSNFEKLALFSTNN